MDLLDNVKQKATAQLDSQKGRATDGLSAIAHAVRGTTDELRRDEHDVMAQYVERMADQLERFSTQLREKDINALISDARELARRQPAIFIGGSFAAGLVAARFIKSSRRGSDGEYERRWSSGGGSDRGGWDRDEYESQPHRAYDTTRGRGHAGEGFGDTRTASFDEPKPGGFSGTTTTPGTGQL